MKYLILLLVTVSVFTKSSSQESTESKVINPKSRLTEIFSDGEIFLEGPTMSKDGTLYFSDITFSSRGMKAGIIWSLNLGTREAKVYRSPSGMSNGLMIDADGNLIACEGADFGGRRVTKTDLKTGKSTIIAGLYNGRPFNAPNDLAIDEKGRIYFTDPRYIGHEPVEQPVMGVYRIDQDGSIHLLAANVDKPNGILVSPDQKTLYVANCNSPGDGTLGELGPDFKGVRPTSDGSVICYELAEDGNLRFKSELIDFGEKVCPDGMAIDKAGNIYIALGDKVGVYTPSGEKLTEIKVPRATNLCFGLGRYSKTLFIVGAKSVYTVETINEGYNIASNQ